MIPKSPILKYTNIGFTFAFEILAFVFFGHYLENKFDFAPWGIITGFIIGFPYAFYQLLLMVKRMGEDIEKDEKK